MTDLSICTRMFFVNNPYLLFRNIKAARVQAGLSQGQLANKVGVSDKTISAYETGRAIPPTVALFSIAKATGVSLLQLTGFKQKSPENSISKKLDSLAENIIELREQTKKSMDVFVGTVLLDESGRIYLIKEDDENKIGKDRWNLPGGAVYETETLTEAVARETKEETGYYSKIVSQVGCYKCKKGDKSWIFIVFAAMVAGLSHNKVNLEETGVKEGKWFSKSEFLKMPVSKMVHSDMHLVYKIAIKTNGLPLDTIKYIDYDLQ